MRKARLKIIAIIMLITSISIGVFLSIKNKPKKFNIILIIIDALRADHLGCYGYNRNTSPNIDKLAKEGALFTRAFSHAPETRTSVPSIFTSLYPSVHKIFILGETLADEFITLPEVLKKKGFITAAFVRSHLKSISNLSKRFDIYDMRSEPPPYNQFEIDMTLNKRVCFWLKQNHSQPFFLYIHYLGAHAPYLPPPLLKRTFWQGDVNELMTKFIGNFYVSLKHNSLNEMWPDNQMTEFAISQYDGKIKFMDEQIALLLEKLEELGLSKNTLVILTSDHGEEFKDHGSFFHGNNLFDESIHVPLIMRLPEVIPKNTIIPELVRHVDIMPTILDILNIHSDYIIQGISLTPLIKGRDGFKLDIFSENYYYGSYLKGIRTDRWKFIETYTPKTGISFYGLYDLESDPKELSNLAGKLTKEAEQLKTKLQDYTLSCEKIRDSILGEGFVAKPPMLDEETKAELRGLGYLQ